MPNSMPIIRRSRLLAFNAQLGKCFYCDLPMWMQSPSEVPHIPKKHAASLQCTAEHLTPRSEKGRDTPDNIAAACLFCNQHRHRLQPPPSPEKYRALVGKQLANGGWHPRPLQALRFRSKAAH
jgi:hypothetical protein